MEKVMKVEVKPKKQRIPNRLGCTRKRNQYDWGKDTGTSGSSIEGASKIMVKFGGDFKDGRCCNPEI
jgi:hypothetical protein